MRSQHDRGDGTIWGCFGDSQDVDCLVCVGDCVRGAIGNLRFENYSTPLGSVGIRAVYHGFRFAAPAAIVVGSPMGFGIDLCRPVGVGGVGGIGFLRGRKNLLQ